MTARPLGPDGQQLGPQLLYVIGVPGASLVKIGIAASPAVRLEDLRRGADRTLCPEGIDRTALAVLYQQPGGRRLELALHRRFAARRVLGEWFDLGPLAVSLIRSAIREPREAQARAEDVAGWKPRRRSPRVIDHKAAAAKLAAEFAVNLPERRPAGPDVVRIPVRLCNPRRLVDL